MLEQIELVDLYYPWFLPMCVFIFGACVGSFLNVVVYRIPKGESLVHPGSHCACGKPIAWYDNIPILTWFLLRGKARCCGARYAFRYPFVELFTALLFLFAWLCLPEVPAMMGFIFIFILIAATFIDLDHMIIPDRFSIGGMVIGVLLSFAVPAMHGYGGDLFFADAMRGGIAGLLGAFIGSACILWIMELSEVILKKEAMGYGDVKFMGAIGAFCGWQGAVFAIFGGAALGMLIVIPLHLFGMIKSGGPPSDEACEDFGKVGPGDQDNPPAKSDEADIVDAEGEEAPEGLMGLAVPFGPMLAGGAALYYIFLRDYVDAYFAQFAELLYMQ